MEEADMFTRIVVTILIVALSACSTGPRNMPQEPAAGHAASPATETAGEGGEPRENNVAVRDTDTDAPQDQSAASDAAKIVAVVLLIVLSVAAIAAASRSMSRHIVKSCCRS